MVAMLDNWRAPRYVTRVWTVFEQFVAAKIQLPVAIIFPPAEIESFDNEVQNNGLDMVSEHPHLPVSLIVLIIEVPF